MSVVPSLPTAAAVDAAVARVLARPELQEAPPTVWQRLWTWLREHLAEWWERIRALLALDPGTVQQTGETLLWVASVIGLAIVVVMLFRVLDGRRLPRSAPATSVLVDEPRARSLAEALAAAAAAAGAGAFLAAARTLYLAVLLWLDAHGHARFADDKTGSEYEREVHPGTLRTAFGSMLRAFYPVAYGGRADAPAAYARMRALASQMGVPER